MKNILSEPYPGPIKTRQRWLISAAAGLGIFVLIYLFRPFGLSGRESGPLFFVSAGYSVITFLVTLFNLFAIPAAYHVFFEEKRWTVGRQILFTAWIIISIGIAIFFYSQALGFIGFDLYGFIYFQTIIFLAGVLPVSLVILGCYSYLMRRNVQAAMSLAKALRSRPEFKPAAGENSIEISSENIGDRLQIYTDSLFYITNAAAENYVEICYLDGHEIKKKLIRNTLSGLESFLDNHLEMFRCHNAWLVNLNKVDKITGNSQGCRLILEETGEIIPVSRSKSKKFLHKLGD